MLNLTYNYTSGNVTIEMIIKLNRQTDIDKELIDKITKAIDEHANKMDSEKIDCMFNGLIKNT